MARMNKLPSWFKLGWGSEVWDKPMSVSEYADKMGLTFPSAKSSVMMAVSAGRLFCVGYNEADGVLVKTYFPDPAMAAPVPDGAVDARVARWSVDHLGRRFRVSKNGTIKRHALTKNTYGDEHDFFASPTTTTEYATAAGVSRPCAAQRVTRGIEDGVLFFAGYHERPGERGPASRRYCSNRQRARKAVIWWLCTESEEQLESGPASTSHAATPTLQHQEPQASV